MATMTIPEAYRLNDILSAAFQDTTSDPYIPVSALEGYDIVQICTAFKLKIANELLLLTGRDNFEERFAELVQHYEKVPLLVMMTVMPDDQIDVDGVGLAFDCMDPQYLSQELVSSFATYCRHVGPDNPLYWQMIYTRLGLEYTSTSPQKNDTVFPDLDAGQPASSSSENAGCLTSVVCIALAGVLFSFAFAVRETAGTLLRAAIQMPTSLK
jgi:hypothetical protein